MKNKYWWFPTYTLTASQKKVCSALEVGRVFSSLWYRPAGFMQGTLKHINSVAFGIPQTGKEIVSSTTSSFISPENETVYVGKWTLPLCSQGPKLLLFLANSVPGSPNPFPCLWKRLHWVGEGTYMQMLNASLSSINKQPAASECSHASFMTPSAYLLPTLPVTFVKSHLAKQTVTYGRPTQRVLVCNDYDQWLSSWCSTSLRLRL